MSTQSTQSISRDLGRRARRLSLAAVAVAITAGLVPTAATAATPSLAITSPAEGEVVSLYADWTTPTVAEDPLVVAFTSDGSPVTCALDDQAPVPCTSPFSFEHVVAGGHSVTVAAGSATQTTSFTVQTVALAPPPEIVIDDGGLLRPPASVEASWRVGSRRTWVRHLELRHMPRHVRVHVACNGSGCPSPQRFTRRASGRLDLTRTFRGHGLRPGTSIVIRVTKSGHRLITFRYTMQHGARPALAIR